MGPVSEQALLEYLRGYDLDYPSLDAAFRADPDLVFEKVCDASYQHADWFTPAVLDAVVARFNHAPDRGFWILHNLAAADGKRARELMDLYASRFSLHPEAALSALYYVSTNNPHLLRQDLVDLVATHISAQASMAFQTFQYVLAKRPELITKPVVEAVVRNLGAQANQAFFFIRDLLKARPEFTPLCTLALFECVFREAQPYQRREMRSDIVAIAGRSHIQT
jgi:hypothetical protein